ncbi:MAG TPA: LuxR C-terminal-related transcriptional regulator, partial [Phnomibacter sp.]|nr:LuxR C-terminal-related transcriptional regulator [Phnomibacter sp.]
QTLQHLATQGYYFNDMVTGKLVHQASQQAGGQTMVSLTAKEEEFLKLASTELTYKEIAERMHVSPRTVDGYRDLLFDKLGVKSRVGLVLFSLKRGIASL